MFWDKLFKRKEKEKEEITNSKENKIPPNEEKIVETTEEAPQEPKKKYVYDPKVQKEVEKEEMKIAIKIAKEHIGDHVENIDSHRKKIKEQGKKEEKIPSNENVYRTGIAGFDSLLGEGGIPLSTSVLVEGGPGSGKTIFCLHVAMDFCRRGKKVLYMSFEEPEERLIEHLESFGFDAKKYVKNGQLVIKRFNALDIARSVEALLSEAKKELLIEVQPILIPKGINPDLVLVDSLTSIASAFSGEDNRFRIYMEQLFRYLEENKMSSLLIREVPNPSHVGNVARSGDEATSFLSDGIIVFYNVVYSQGKRTRAVEILKLRGQPFDRRIVEAEILNKKGLVIYPKKVLKGKYTLT
jgi:KaiC/GvpD/RAD55 family RecA-like ATPase